MEQFTIETDEGKKARSFTATCLGIITANGLFPESGGKTIRPVWAVFAGSETSLKPFIANLRTGRKASNRMGRQSDSDRLEFIKSSQFHVHWQKEPSGTLVTIHHPELFKLDPGMTDPEQVRFVLVVPEDWASAQEGLDPFAVDYVLGLQEFPCWECPLTKNELTRLLPTAYLFAAYLDRRTHMPLITDGRFYLQILCSALKKGVASFPGNDIKYNHNYHRDWGIHAAHGLNTSTGKSYGKFDPSKLGIRNIVSCCTTQIDFEAFLREEVSLFFKATEDLGSFRNVVDVLDPYLLSA